MSRTHELAWCAGFFDGEGYISISKRKQKSKGRLYTGHYLRIGINHVRPEPLIKVHNLLGGSLRFDTNSDLHCSDGYKRQKRYCWVASTQEAGRILKELMPFFINKNKEAAIALDFQQTMQTSKQAVPQEVTDTREQFFLALKSLNANG